MNVLVLRQLGCLFDVVTSELTHFNEERLKAEHVAVTDELRRRMY